MVSYTSNILHIYLYPFLVEEIKTNLNNTTDENGYVLFHLNNKTYANISDYKQQETMDAEINEPDYSYLKVDEGIHLYSNI